MKIAQFWELGLSSNPGSAPKYSYSTCVPQFPHQKIRITLSQRVFMKKPKITRESVEHSYEIDQDKIVPSRLVQDTPMAPQALSLLLPKCTPASSSPPYTSDPGTA